MAITVVTVHWPVLSTKTLCFDDYQYLTKNTLVQKPSWNSAKRFLVEVFEPSTVQGYYQPLTMIWLMIDFSVAESTEDLTVYHITSLICHILNMFLVAMLLYVLFDNIWIATICALLFGLHPMTVETIALISEKKTLLASFFALWSLLGYILFTKKRRWFYYGISLVTYILALLAKPTATTVPMLLLLLDVWPLKRLNSNTLLEKIPFVGVMIPSAIITFISQSSLAPANIGGEYGIQNIWLVFCYDMVFYPLKMLYPVNLSYFYPFPAPFNLSNPILIWSVIGTVILLSTLILSTRWTKAPLISWLFFFIAILPTLQVYQFSNVIASDKFAYLPSFGFMMILALSLKMIWSRSNRFFKILIFVIIALVYTGEILATRNYLVHWKETLTYFKYMLTKTPGNSPIHFKISEELLEKGRYKEAEEHYWKGIKREPSLFYNDHGTTLAQSGKIDEAIIFFRKSIEFKHDFAVAHYNLAKALRIKGDKAGAILEYQEALKHKKDHVQAYNNLGGIYMEQKKYDEAINCFQQAIDYSPNFEQAYNNLGLALIQKGQAEQAIVQFRKALEIKPDYPSARANLNKALQLQKSKAQ